MKKSVRGLIFKLVCLVLALMLVVPVAARDVGSDLLIQTDPVRATYRGRPQSVGLINRLRFTDLPSSPQMRDAIVRLGAMEIIRPDASTFRPNAAITVQDAIIFSLRAAGQSAQAMELGVGGAAAPLGGETPPLGEVWADGYMQLATQIGLLDAGQGANAATTPARREDVAGFLVGALQNSQPGIFASTGVGISLQSFSDWNDISAERSQAVESLLQHNIMSGNTATTFGPDSQVTRGEMAQIIRNLDNLHYGMLGLVRVRGVVGQITSEQRVETGATATWQRVYVRRADGLVDVLEFSASAPGPQPGPIDAVVLRNGSVTGLRSLQVDDQVEYLVHLATNTVWYVLVGTAGQVDGVASTFRGRLDIIDFPTGTMTLRSTEGNVYTFVMASGLFQLRNGQNYIRFSPVDFRRADDLPRGVYYELNLVGNVIQNIRFIGNEVLFPEFRGIVIDNNYWMGSITILDQNRVEHSFTYIPGVIRVQRRVFYDMRDVVGGVHEMFPRPLPRETTMEDVIPGDIVVFWVDEEDPLMITALSAAENTTSRWGRVRELIDQGGHHDMLLEFDGGRTAWFTFVNTVLVIDRGRPVPANTLQLGDWVRLIINQAVVAPGVQIESIREIAIDSGGHHVSSVVKGYLAGFNHIQNRITLNHAQELTPAGWSNHSHIETFDINNPNIRFFHDGRRVSLAHINRYLQRSEAVVYMAVENHFRGRRVVMLSVRTGRDELLEPDFVLATADNEFMMLGVPGEIDTDEGTIVVRNGRLVSEHHIFPDDWSTVSLNGNTTAAVVYVGAPPAVSGVHLVIGRVSQVFPFRSFRVDPIYIFNGFQWDFSPQEAQFAIDHNTIFIEADGTVSDIDTFLGFGPTTRIDDIYVIVVDGGRAARVIDVPFFNPIPVPELMFAGHLVVQGTVTAAPPANGGVMMIHDVHVFDGNTGAWNLISRVDATGSINVAGNTIIMNRNLVIPPSGIRAGQQVRVFTNLPATTVVGPSMPPLDVHIVIVDPVEPAPVPPALVPMP